MGQQRKPTLAFPFRFPATTKRFHEKPYAMKQAMILFAQATLILAKCVGCGKEFMWRSNHKLYENPLEDGTYFCNHDCFVKSHDRDKARPAATHDSALAEKQKSRNEAIARHKDLDARMPEEVCTKCAVCGNLIRFKGQQVASATWRTVLRCPTTDLLLPATKIEKYRHANCKQQRD